MIGRRRRSVGPGALSSEPRRGGPAGEQRWWDPADQAAVEALVVPRGALGRGWVDVPMVNNEEPVEPYGSGPASDAVRAARSARRLTALDGGRAWRRREGKVLAVLRLERFADAGIDRDLAAAHRSVWQQQGGACLEETWRANWGERGVGPGWIEARAVAPEARPDPLHVFGAATAPPGPAAAVDWFRVEDHTGGPRSVVMYSHLAIWRGRSLATLTVRYDIGLDLDQETAGAASVVYRVLGV